MVSRFAIVPGADSPMTTIGTSTWIFSPFFTTRRSMCSMIWCTGSFCTSLTSVSCDLPLTSSSSTTLARRMSSETWWPGQGDVHGVGAVAVDDGGDLAGGAEAAGEALAEVLAELGVDLGVGFSRHGVLLAGAWPGKLRRVGRSDSACAVAGPGIRAVFDSNASA